MANNFWTWIARIFFHDLHLAWTIDQRPGRARRFALQVGTTIGSIVLITGIAILYPEQTDAVIEMVDDAEYWTRLIWVAALVIAIGIACNKIRKQNAKR